MKFWRGTELYARPLCEKSRARHGRVLAGLTSALLLTSAAEASYWVFNTPPPPVRDTYGEIGAFDTPSARMAPDGELAFTYGALGEQQRYSLAFQALPWLEGSFRYSHVVGRYSGYINKHFYDRSFGVKVRVVKESELLPDVSFGIRDILGTGILTAEYVAASKSIGPFDVTAGMGWGNLAQRAAFPNPLGLLSDKFKIRGGWDGTGKVAFGRFFRGRDVGVFGSLAWQTPLDGLQVLAEYSSDKYIATPYAGGVRVRSPLNIGLSYRPLDSVSISGGWYYGTTYGVVLSVRGDVTKTYPSAVRVGPRVPQPAIRTDSQQQNALRDMQGRTNQAATARTRNNPWVDVPTPEQHARQNLLQALLSETSGVRSAELKGRSLIIDARVSTNPSDQCARYARVARGTGSDFSSLAVADLQDPSGAVVMCSTAMQTASLVSATGMAGGSLSKSEIAGRVRNDLGGQDIAFVGLTVGANEAWLFYENYRYSMAAEAAGRAVRVLMADLPPNIETFHLTPSILGMRLNEITLYRSDLERSLAGGTTNRAGRDVVKITAPSGVTYASEDEGIFKWPTLYTSFDPRVTQRVFDPDHPIQFRIYGDLVNLVQITPQISLTAQVTGTLWSNYSFVRDAGSELHHVRTDVLKYDKNGKYGIANLSMSYRTRVADSVFGEIKGGYLEDMYAGVGAQLLWRPEDSRFAVGADIYKVWQRAYDRLFGLQKFGGKHYSVITGHVTAYYDSPWYGLRFAVHAGRYLAEDRGATFEISRRFASGVEIGAWATFTNVPFSKFGEGSFDKGITIHIPFEWGLPVWTQSSYDVRMASLTRDGGQRLAGDDSLFVLTDSGSYGQLMDHADAILEP